MKLNFFILILLPFTSSAFGQELSENRIKEAVCRQLEAYPQSSLRDLYKNFFQDRFGPGHIVSDTASAGKYLREELAAEKDFRGPYYEQTGYSGDFYRVNLSLVKEGIIPYQVFFDAFIHSVKDIKPVAVKEWAEDWRLIESVISQMGMDLPDYKKDKVAIRQLLEQGKYAMHHSRTFVENYDPHYRIISKDIFEKELLPLINKNTQKEDI